jgi:MFS family permease
VLGDDALQAGLSFLPWTLSVFAGSTLAARSVARFGLRPTVAAGMLLATVGMAWFTGLRPGGSYFAVVLPGAITAGLGMGLGLVASTIAATQGVPANQSGLASGLLNMSRLFGGALGLAVLSTIATSASHVGRGVSALQATTNGFGTAFDVAAVVTLVGAALALTLLRPPAAHSVVEVAAREEEAEVLAA